MQFIHLGRRTGTLSLHRGDEQAMIGFHSGKLISARSAETPKLGDMLLEAGLIDEPTLRQAVQDQESGDGTMSLGRVLIASGKIEQEALRQMVSQQIEQTISNLVAWDNGSFEFAVDDLRPIDDIALQPGEVVPEGDINTQMVLLEAARIFDERNRSEAERAGEGDTLDDTHPVLPDTEHRDEPEALAESQVIPPDFGTDADHHLATLTETTQEPEHTLQVVSSDDDFFNRLKAAVPDQITTTERLPLMEAGRPAPGSLAPIVLVDLREGQATLSDIASFHERRPTTPVIALVDRVVPVSQVYGAGALAALSAEVDAVVACVINVMQSQQQLARFTGQRPAPRVDTSGVERLRRVYGDLRSGLLSATVALNLMHIISESVERAILFLVRRDCLQALGAFGLGKANKPLAELTRGMKLDLEESNVFTESLHSGEACSTNYAEAILPESVRKVLGAPLTGQVVVFPVLGAQRVISVIYTDNGQVDRPIEDIDILELATAQVGMAFENELLRRQITDADG
jgi:hypothetical protein